MSVYRYARRSPPGEPASNDAAPSVDVTLTNPALKADLDRTMGTLGYEFVDVSIDAPHARSPLAFPETGTPPPVGAGAARVAPAALRVPANHVAPEPPEDRPTPRLGALAAPGDPRMPDAPSPAALELPSLLGAEHGVVSSFRAGSGVGRAPFDDADPGASDEPRIVGRRETMLAVASVAVLALVVHAVAVTSAFRTDDYLSLYASVANGFFRFLTSLDFRTAPLMRVVQFVFERVFHARPLPFFLFPLLLHVVAAALLTAVLLRLTRRPFLAAALGAAWAATPLHQNALASLASLGSVVAGLVLLLLVRRVLVAGEPEAATSPRALAGSAALLLLASLSASSGVALALAAPVVIWLLVPAGDARRRALVVSGAFAFAAFVLYLVARILVTEPIGKFFPGVPLLLELFFYGAGAVVFGPIVAVDPDGRKAGLVDDAGSAVGLSLIAFVACAALVALAIFRGKPALKRSILALSTIPLAAYLVATFDATDLVRPQGAAFVAVHADLQYVATIGLVLVVATALSGPRLPFPIKPWMGPAACAAVFLLLAVPSALVAFHSGAGAREARKAGRTRVETALSDVIEHSPPDKDLYVHNAEVRPLVGATDPAAFPRLGAFFAVTHSSDVAEGRRVRFVESDAAVLSAIQKSPSARIRELFVSDSDTHGAVVAWTDLEPKKSVQVHPAARSPRSRRLGDSHRLPFKH